MSQVLGSLDGVRVSVTHQRASDYRADGDGDVNKLGEGLAGHGVGREFVHDRGSHCVMQLLRQAARRTPTDAKWCRSPTFRPPRRRKYYGVVVS